MTKISLTPIIDVVFILLIFFMLASNFNKVGELNMDISKESTKASDDDMKIIKLLVRQDQTVISDGKVYISTKNGRLFIINFSNSELQKILKLDKEILQRPVYFQRELYVAKDNSIIKIN